MALFLARIRILYSYLPTYHLLPKSSIIERIMELMCGMFIKARKLDFFETPCVFVWIFWLLCHSINETILNNIEKEHGIASAFWWLCMSNNEQASKQSSFNWIIRFVKSFTTFRLFQICHRLQVNWHKEAHWYKSKVNEVIYMAVIHKIISERSVQICNIWNPLIHQLPHSLHVTSLVTVTWWRLQT